MNWEQLINDNFNGRGAISVPPRSGVLVEGESLKQMVLDEITRVERDVWKLT